MRFFLRKINIYFKNDKISMRVRQRDAEKEMHYIDLFTHRPPARDLRDGALTKSPVNYHHF